MQPDFALTQVDIQTVFQIASASIEEKLLKGVTLELDLNDFSLDLRTKKATFVTLRIDGLLRGCIGTIVPTQALVLDVSTNARAAAFSDPRFPALSKTEFHQLQINISILSALERIVCTSRDELRELIRPGIDGLLVEVSTHLRGTFLPAVWDELPEPEDFLQRLWTKAGLPSNYWSDSLRIYRYTTHTIG